MSTYLSSGPAHQEAEDVLSNPDWASRVGKGSGRGRGGGLPHPEVPVGARRAPRGGGASAGALGGVTRSSRFSFSMQHWIVEFSAFPHGHLGFCSHCHVTGCHVLQLRRLPSAVRSSVTLPQAFLSPLVLCEHSSGLHLRTVVRPLNVGTFNLTVRSCSAWAFLFIP